uniref:Fatty-acyl-CoA synthase n=1 Tax=Candidatus Kentrum sp. TUN TaxID=2126343 RepID=A0A451A3I5_9GAMM|nr:MAG: fatty-acyl-CoA synthase [Candidatus Kentron sp. TUN]
MFTTTVFSHPPLRQLRNANLSLGELAEEYDRIAREETRHWDEINRNGEIGYADVFERIAHRHGDRTAVIEVESGLSYTLSDLDRAADKIAHWVYTHFDADRVGIYHKNSFAFLAAVLGLAKAGKPAVLFNQREPPHGIARLAERYGVDHILGRPVSGVLCQEIQPLLEQNWPGRAPGAWRRNVDRGDPVVIIFTSGTTGMGKPGLFNHRRMIGAGLAWSLRTYMSSEDRCYITLPLCHGNALAVAFSSCLMAGAIAVIREKFSVRDFLPDIRRFRCTAMVYVGELWRYLLNRSPRPDDAQHPLRTIFGNGLERSLWEPVITRFGITHVVEHFGATEMPASALTNWTGRPGHCGFIPPNHRDACAVLLVDESGREVPYGEVGEVLLGTPGNHYRGYLDPAFDSARIWSDVQVSGDTWWRSGDLLRRTEDGFFTFIARRENNFRWKGENVSTAEVESVIYATGWFQEVVVYGVPVPGFMGKTGMASLLPKATFGPKQLKQLLAFLEQELSPFAIPHFLRIVSEPHGITSTLKIKKSVLIKEGFSRIGAFPHYVLSKSVYSPLTASCLNRIRNKDFPLGFSRG